MVELNVEKSADRNYIFLNMTNRVKYSVIITNLGNHKATCVKIKDCMSLGARYIPGTFTINGARQNINEIDKFVSIGAIRPGANILVSYDVEVVEYNTPTEIINRAIVSYCDENNSLQMTCSQEFVVPAVKIDVSSCKIVDKSISKIGDVLSYSVLVRNNSNISIDNIVFYDDLSSSLELLPSSVLVNQTPQYIENFDGGLCVGTLNAYSSLIVNFQTKVIGVPATRTICNMSRVEFSYTICDGGIPVSSIGETSSNQVTTKITNESISC